MIDSIAKKLSLVMPMRDLSKRIDAIVQGDVAGLGRWLTLSHWCDDTFGTEIVRQINDQLIKWCEAFLDEGHATWAMPDREKGMYQAWKTIASHEWSPCGIADSGRKISALPDYPEDALLESLDALGIPSDLRQDYLSLQLTALPGWAGFIKWRGEERDYPWQQAYPAGLVKFLAIRLWYARELVQKACRENSASRDAMMRSTPTCGTIPRNTICDVSGSRGDCRRCMRRRWIGWRIREAMGGVTVLQRYRTDVVPRQQAAARRGMAKRLVALARSFDIDPAGLTETPTDNVKQVIEWMEAFPESDHGPMWLKAFESGYQAHLLTQLRPARSVPDDRCR